MISDSLPADYRQRQLALDPDQSFICEAPAGSGKTELLTQRVLTLLARVEKPESVLAITFTRKAAAEMRERILHALHAGRQAKPIEPHAQTTWHLAHAVLQRDEALQWHVLHNPNRLQIRTFDSLCSMLTQTLPLHASLGVNISTSEDSDSLYRDAVSQLLETLEHDVPWADALRFLLMHLDNQFSRVEELLIKMLQSRDAWMPVVNAQISGDEVRDLLESHLHHVVEDKIARLQQLLPDEVKESLLALGDFAAANIQRMNIDSPLIHLKQLSEHCDWPDHSEEGQVQWRALAHLLLTQKLEWRKRLDKNCGFPTGDDKHEKAAFKQQKQVMQELLLTLIDVPDLLAALQDVFYWPTAAYRRSQWQVLQALTAVLPVLVAHLQLVFRARGEVDFLEMGTRARLALGDDAAPTDLALRLDYKIQHILVDEFQDTSFTQVELIQRLTAGWQPGDGRTLFCVGDAMQSIYGFRGANVGLFLHCRTHGLGCIPLTPLRLTTNFRSQAGVVHWINNTFAHAFPAQHDISSGAVAYSYADDFRSELPGAAVEMHVYGPDHEALQGRLVVALIEQSRAEMPDGRIAILARNRNHVAAIIPALKQAGMRFRAVDLEPLAEQETIADLVALTRALLYPADRIAWLSLLRGPWCGLSLAELEWVAQQLRGNVDELVFAQINAALAAVPAQVDLFASVDTPLSLEGQQRLRRLQGIMDVALRERQRKPLRQWVEGVWLQLGGAACLQNAADADNVERYLGLLDALSAGGMTPSIDLLEQHLEKLYAAPDPSADESLQIMTVHKSKGLEFDTVILPGLHRQPRSGDPELLLWQERLSLQGQEEWLLAPISPVGQDKDPIYRHLEHEKKKREQFEACRLLYVACTRAKKRLHLLAEVKRSEEDEVRFKPPASGCLLSYIWSSVALMAKLHEVDKDELLETDTASVLVHERPIQRLPASWRLPSLPDGKLLEHFVPPFEFNNQAVDIQWQQDRAASVPRHVGTLVHQILQTVGEQGLSHWADRDLTQCQAAWTSRLLNLGLSPGQARMAMPQVMQCVQRALQNEHFVWLLRGECEFEYPISRMGSGEVQHSVIDVLRLDGDTAWVVDYKTSFPEDGQEPDAFIEAQVDQYRKTMVHYCKMIRQLGFANVKGALYFPMLGHWQVV